MQLATATAQQLKSLMNHLQDAAQEQPGSSSARRLNQALALLYEVAEVLEVDMDAAAEAPRGSRALCDAA